MQYVVLNLIVLTDSEDGCCEQDDDRPLDHYEEIDMEDYEYCPNVYN